MKLTITRPSNIQWHQRDHNQSNPVITLEASSVRDEYHSMHELYDHRCTLFAALLKAIDLPVYKTLPVDGWFIAGVMLPAGQVGYHLPDSFYPLIKATVDAPEWDGHTSADAISRLMAFLEAK